MKNEDGIVFNSEELCIIVSNEDRFNKRFNLPDDSKEFNHLFFVDFINMKDYGMACYPVPIVKEGGDKVIIVSNSEDCHKTLTSISDRINNKNLVIEKGF